MDGTQSPGINYNSIDGLTAINATSITINGSTVNLASYVPYIGASSTININTQTLTGLANASALTDAVNLQTMNAKTYIGDATSYRIESLSGNQNEYFALKSEYASGNFCSQEDYTSKYLYGQAIRFYLAPPSYAFIGSIVQSQADNSLNINADSRLRLNAPTVFISGVISSNGSQIKNVANGTLSSDVATVGQLPSLTGYVPYSGATSNVDLNTKLLKNIGDGVSNTDAITLQQLNNKRYDTIQNGAADVYVNCGLTNLTLQAAALGKINTGSKVNITPSADAVDVFNVNNLAGASKFYIDTTGTNRSQFTTALTVRTTSNTGTAFDVKNSALTSIFTVDTLNSLINANSCKITNLANGTASADAVNFGQLSTISSLITPGLPTGNLQGSYVLHNGTSYYNASTSRVSLGISSLNTNPTLLASTFGTVAIGALAANIDSGFHSLVATATINYDASGLTVGASNPTMTNTGTLGSSGTKSSGAGNATVVNSGIIGSLNELSIPSNCVYQFGTGAGLTYPNMTVAAVFRTPSGNGFFIEHGFNYNTNPSFYLSNGIPYFGGPSYYTNQCVGVSTAPALDDFQTTTPRNIAGTNGFGSGLGTESYTIAIMTFSATATIFQCYLIPTNSTAILGQTQYGPYTKTYAAMGSSTNASNLIYINRRNAQAQILCQMLVFNQTFTQEQVSQLQSYLRVKWFSNISGNLSNNISVGYASGFSKQSFNSVAIGPWAGSSSQGIYSVAIGNKAGQSSQPDYSIVINGMETALNPTTSGLFINPIRQVPFAEPRPRGLMYKLDTKELVYNETTIWNVIIIGQAASNPSATLPLVYFMPTGVRVDSSSYTCTVVRNLQGDYTLTFPASANPNFSTYTTITTGVNARISAGSNLCIAKWTSSNTIDINYVYAAVAWVDLMVGTNISLRIEF